MKINRESQPIRCEVCHKRDMYDPSSNFCTRCKNISNDRNIPKSKLIRIFPNYSSWLQKLPLIRNLNLSGNQIFVLSWICVFIIVGISFIDLPYSNRYRSDNGANAIMFLRELSTAQEEYKNNIGKGNYGTVAELYKNGLIKENIFYGRVYKGYRFLFYYDQSQLGRLPRFQVLAIVDIKSGMFKSGDRNFFLDETGVIRFSFSEGELATKNSNASSN